MEEINWLFQQYGIDVGTIMKYGGLVFIVVEYIKSELPAVIVGWKAKALALGLSLLATVVAFGTSFEPATGFSIPAIPVLLLGTVGIFIVGAGINRGLQRMKPTA